jgi:hypothetical protein
MASWRVWDWIAYTCLLLAAIIIAADAGLKNAPNVMLKMPEWVMGEYWSFAPLCLIFVGSAIFIAKALRDKVARRTSQVTATAPMRSESLATVDTRQNVVQPIPAVDSDRIFVSRTPEQLMDVCRGKMAVENDRIMAPFIKRWIRTQIIVDDVSIPSSGGTIWAGEASRRIISKFDKKWDTRLHLLFKREHLEINGKIEHVDGSAMHLTECEII